MEERTVESSDDQPQVETGHSLSTRPRERGTNETRKRVMFLLIHEKKGKKTKKKKKNREKRKKRDMDSICSHSEMLEHLSFTSILLLIR